MTHPILDLIDKYWKFDNDQTPMSTWHDKQDLLKAVEELLPKDDVIWLKISDAIGFIDISKGQTMKDIDNHITLKEIGDLLGDDVYDKLCELNNTNYLTIETDEFMNSLGWVEKSDFWKSNGDVHAHCYERIK